MSYPFFCDFHITKEEDGGFCAHAVINEDGITTQGDTLEELLANCEEAVQCYFHEHNIKTKAEIKVVVNMGLA